MQSNPKLYTTMKYHGWAAAMAKKDYYQLFMPLTQLGYAWDSDSTRMKAMGEGYMSAETPWVHVMGTPFKNCGLDHHVTFNTYNIIPPKCLNCWKTVVTPNSFKQLMELKAIEEQMGVPCKCGIELRDYTPKHYGGYFYDNSLEEGRLKYEMVRKAVDDNMSDGKDVGVILKRGCTEYEMLKGPSHMWHNTRDEEQMLELIDSFVDYRRGNNKQNHLVQNHVQLKWMLWAHMQGDMTYKEWNGGESLFPDYVKYHEQPLEDLQHDLALAHAAAKLEGGAGEMDEFMQVAQKFADKHEIENTGILAHALGAQWTPQMSLPHITLREDTPDELKGEHNE
jgi:hypothetical protein